MAATFYSSSFACNFIPALAVVRNDEESLYGEGQTTKAGGYFGSVFLAPTGIGVRRPRVLLKLLLCFGVCLLHLVSAFMVAHTADGSKETIIENILSVEIILMA